MVGAILTTTTVTPAGWLTTASIQDKASDVVNMDGMMSTQQQASSYLTARQIKCCKISGVPQRQERRLFRYNCYNRTLPSVSGCSNALLIPLQFLHIHNNPTPKSPRHISHHNLKPGCTIMPPSTTGGGGIVFSGRPSVYTY